MYVTVDVFLSGRAFQNAVHKSTARQISLAGH